MKYLYLFIHVMYRGWEGKLGEEGENRRGKYF